MNDCPSAIDEKGVASDRAALIAIYDALGGDNWVYAGNIPANTNWKTDAPSASGTASPPTPAGA